MSNRELLLGLDIGGTKCAAVVGNSAGEVVQRSEWPAHADRGPHPMIEDLIGQGRRLLAAHPGIGRVGITIGGPLDSRQGLVLSPPNLPGWDRVPLVERVQEALHLPAALENDANACAVAEWHWGLGRRVSDLVYLTCGTGQGAGIVLGGRLHRGCRDLAGEIGHVRLLPLGPVGYYKAGSVEGLTSGRALGELARLRIQEPHPASCLDGVGSAHTEDGEPGERMSIREDAAGHGTLSGKAVCEAALAGDAFARGVVAELGEHLGRACAILIDVLNPQRISLGSLALRLGELLLAPVRRAAKEESLPIAFDACEIAPAALGARIQDLAPLAVAAGICA